MLKSKAESRQALLAFAIVLSAASVSTTAQISMSLRHDVGQTVAPVFEGWEPNSDGTFSLYFGYMNRNYKEEIEIPVGPNNRMEPGDADRGQATHFLPRRNKKVFRVIVPKHFGDQKLTWSLSVHDHTETVPASLNPKYQINTVRDEENGNTPPVVTAGPDQTVTRPAAATLTVSVTDDGLPQRRDGSSRVTVQWNKYRGPGVVTFSPAEQTVKDGKATTVATFGRSGVYVIQAIADDGSKAGTHCCWTNTQLTVTVR